MREEVFSSDHANNGSLVWIAHAQVSETLRSEDVEALFNAVVSLDHKGMLLDVRSHVHQLVQVLVDNIFKYIFAVRIFLVKTRQDVLPSDLFFKRCCWEPALLFVVVGCVHLVRLF